VIALRKDRVVDRPWLAHYDPGVPAHIDYPDITLPQLFQRTAERYPDRTCTIFHGRKISYRETQRQIEAFAAGLRRLGIRRGDRVALMLPNVPQFVVAYFGALHAGAVVVPTNPLYTRPELEHQLEDAGATAIVTLDLLFGRLEAALPGTHLRTVVVAGVEEALPPHLRLPYLLKQRRMGVRRVRPGGVVRRFREVVTALPPVAATLDGGSDGTSKEPAKAGDLALLQYTGGTTGRSKGAMLTHRNLVANALQAFHWQGARDEEEVSILCATPFFHVYGMSIGMNLAVVAGAAMLLVPRWNAKEVASIARKHRPAMFPGVPTMYLALADLPGVGEREFGSLRACISGAAPLPPEVQRRFERVSHARLVEGYGLTEASPVTHCNPVHGDTRPGTIGVPFPDTDAIITHPETWEPVPLGEVGEMTVRGPQVMAGYWNRPEETLAILRDGWLHTGDLSAVDGDGYFRIVDRKKDLIIAGGYNVYPREVEDVLYSHPKVAEAAVIGVPSEYRGETVKAVVSVRAGMKLTEDEVIAFCRERLAAYKVPRIIEFRDELPKSLIGKVLRRELREDISTPASAQRPSQSA
jgi:long-chain acyl-CoA synthetase